MAKASIINQPEMPTVSARVESDLSADSKQYTFLAPNTADPAVWAAVTAEAVFAAPLQTKGIDGSSVAKHVPLPIAGTCFVKLGGTLSRGARVRPGAGGKASAAAAGEQYVGILLDGGVDDDVVSMLIQFGERHT